MLGLPAIRIQANGVIFFNRLAVELIGKDVEKGVVILQDKKNPKDFYLHFSVDGFKIKPYKKEDNTFYFQQKKLGDLMRDAIKTPRKAFGLKILDKQMQDSIMVYPLLTSQTI